MAHCQIDPDLAFEEKRDREAGFFDWEDDVSADSDCERLFGKEKENEHMERY